ncbi:MAG: S-adenosylmethionine decarboxylase proenzyme [Deltaproteobacteria bacterium]|nr:S-adenosylmethionine decarboxylase proenzyme [Deltaproteobacteria bacterium]
MKILGRHILVEYYDCTSDCLNNTQSIQNIMEEAARKSNATIVESAFHNFNPHGVSGVVVIAESHLAIHTWPEYNYAAVDLFTCGESVDPWAAFDVIKDRLGAIDVATRELKRGLPGPANMPDVPIAHKPEVA